MSQTTVHSILKSYDLRLYTVEYWCGKSRVTEFEEKMLNVVALYMNPLQNALVLSVDEKAQIQVLDGSQLVFPLISGKPKLLIATYKDTGPFL